MLVDASAIVAILTREPEADALVDRLDRRIGCITPAVAVFEAVAAICRKRQASVGEARADVGQFLETPASPRSRSPRQTARPLSMPSTDMAKDESTRRN
jgi:uncharacterized protein with PIN domain